MLLGGNGIEEIGIEMKDIPSAKDGVSVDARNVLKVIQLNFAFFLFCKPNPEHRARTETHH